MSDPGIAVGDNRRAMLLMFAFAALWAAIEALAAPVLYRYSGYQIVWTRYAVHLALMLAVWGWREPESLWRTRRPGFQLARSMLMLVMPASWIIAMDSGVNPHTLMAVFWLSPLLILALARAFGGERAHPAVWIAVAVGYGGALLLHPPTRPGSLASLAFPLGMALSFSLYVVMTRSLRDETTRANLFYTALGVFLVLTPAMPAVWVTPSAGDALVLACVGVLGFFALYTLDRAAHAAPVSVSAPLIYMQIPVFLGFLFVVGSGGDWSLRRVPLAFLLIAGAAIYMWTRESRPRIADGEAPGALRRVPKEP